MEKRAAWRGAAAALAVLLAAPASATRSRVSVEGQGSSVELSSALSSQTFGPFDSMLESGGDVFCGSETTSPTFSLDADLRRFLRPGAAYRLNYRFNWAHSCGAGRRGRGIRNLQVYFPTIDVRGDAQVRLTMEVLPVTLTQPDGGLLAAMHVVVRIIARRDSAELRSRHYFVRGDGTWTDDSGAGSLSEDLRLASSQVEGAAQLASASFGG